MSFHGVAAGGGVGIIMVMVVPISATNSVHQPQSRLRASRPRLMQITYNHPHQLGEYANSRMLSQVYKGKRGREVELYVCCNRVWKVCTIDWPLRP